MTVEENLAFPLDVRKLPKAEIVARVKRVLDMVQLADYGKRRPGQLSGGQQQRVAVGRALVFDPKLVLMDEPLGALDRQLRKHVQLEIRRLHQQLGRTTIYVTHDQEEALVMSDRIGVMSEGRLEQVDSARALYERPANSFVASFLGESNLLDGIVTDLADGRAGFAIDGLAEEIDGIAAAGLALRRRAVALVRPEDVRILPCNAPGFPARVEELVYLGELIAVRVRLGNGKELWSRRFAREGLPSEKIHIGWDPEHVRILPRSDNPAMKEDQG
jgi:ABC-type Fe3+/spermidine/putrescine transport system ATPase subunit